MRSFLSVIVVLLSASLAAAQDMPLSLVLLPGEGWRPVGGDFEKVRALAADAKGELYVADQEGTRVRRVGPDGRVHSWAKPGSPVRALACGADGTIYACQQEKKRIVVLTADGEKEVATGLQAVGLAVTREGAMYAAVPAEHAVYLVGPDGKKRRVAEGTPYPSGMTLWLDGGTLVVGDASGKHLYAFRVEKDGTLSSKEKYYTLRTRAKEPSEVAALTVDSGRRLYAASREGVQVFDPTGRLSGVLLRPRREAVTGVAFGGADFDRLYVVCGGKLYVRKTKAKGAGAAGRSQ